MSFFELLLLAVGLSMDAFSVSICKGLALRRITVGNACIVGAWFGGFQFLMPVIGWLLGSRFAAYINRWDHWIIFALLLLIGGNMIREAVWGKDEEKTDASLSVRSMLPLAIATSIDALAAGVTFSLLEISVIPASAFIGVVTFAFSAAGVKIGSLFGLRYEKKAAVCGGIILILLGIKILLEHMGVL
ncbi:MAG: manganese efflux pump [Clostridia bacterium]|nr:manganese efflux pump [Clostridia bacterium]MBR5383249.1 manganese efflux pump [Clostridia bacterium]